MKHSILTLTATLFLVALLLSCDKNETEGKLGVFSDCVFIQDDDTRDGELDDDERKIMDDCRENRLTSISTIESNLIGEWRLTGHVEGWIPTISQPCANLIISENELTFEFINGSIDTITTHQWKISKYTLSNETYFSLVVIPEPVVDLSMHVLCEDHMYGGLFVIDENTYIYTKVQ
mgnify:CR=1 FL=1